MNFDLLHQRFNVHPGYYNPLLAYGEDKAIHDAATSGANGFIMVDLPPEEAVGFRKKCANMQFVISASCRLFMLILLRLSYIPLIAPSTTLERIEYLCSIADTFIYVISKAPSPYFTFNALMLM